MGIKLPPSVKMDPRVILVALFVVVSFTTFGYGEMIAKCPPEYVQMGGTGECFLFHKYGKRTWNDAQKYCERERGKLVSIGSVKVTSWLALQVVETGLVGDSSNFWIGAKYNTNTSKWMWDATNEVVNFDIIPLDPESNGNYGSLTTDSTLKGHKNSEMYHFICHIDIEKTFNCDFEEGWHQANDRCYNSPEGKTSWNNAEVMCKQLGGYLITLNGGQEQMFAYDISQRWHDNIWIGMTERDNATNYHWVGPTSDYLHWNKNLSMPVSLDGFGSGLIDYEDVDGLWVTETTTNTHHYLCEKNKGACVMGWELHKDSCYFFNSMESDKVTWTTAEQLCLDVGAKLIVITTEGEDNYIKSMMPEQDHLWIGLYTNVDDKNFYWVSGSKYTHDNFTKMTTTDETAALETGVKKCAYYQILDLGTTTETSNWKPVECTEVNKYICEVPKGQDVHMIIPPKDQYCPDGWKLDSDFCYFPSQEEVSWAAADNFCRKNAGDLTSVNSWIEQDYIREMLYADSWIGLNDRYVNNEYVWTDGNKLTITNWNEGEPTGGAENCVEMKFSTGYWNDLTCSILRPYICKRPYSNTPIDPVTTTTPTPESKACGHDWVEDLNTGICYRVFNEFLMYDDARLHCREQHYTDGQSRPDLVSISTAADQLFVQSLLINSQQTDPSFFIGLLNDVTDGLRWTDGDPVTFSNFKSGEPNNVYSEECVEIYNDGVYQWNDIFCTDRRPFICEKKGTNFVPLPPPKPPIVDCPSGWEFFNQHCYYIADTSSRGSWQSAKDQCSYMYNSGLVSITNYDENQFLLSHLATADNDNLWIGLYADGDDGSFGWIDGTPLEYTNWLPGEPNNQDGYEPCGEMLSSYNGYSGVWNDILCSYLNRGACKMNFKVCPQSWTFHNGKCYYISDNYQTWDLALQKCKEVDGEATLLSIHSQAETEFVQELIDTNYVIDVWIGLVRYSLNETWVWSDGSAMDFPNWAPGQPEKNDTEFCALRKSPDGLVHNYGCDYSTTYACEFFPTHNVACEEGWQLYEGWCYFTSSIKDPYGYVTFDEANQRCLEMDAQLPSIHSLEENDFIASMVSESSFSDSWIGLTDVDSQGELKWTDGTVVDYTKLAAADAYTSAPVCFGQTFYTNGGGYQWNDASCTYINMYFCKKEMTVTAVGPTDTGCNSAEDLFHEGSCYRKVDEVANYETAKTNCPNLVPDSHLVTIKDQLENAFLAAYYPTLGERVWIGLEKYINPDESVEFNWLDGTPFTFSNWGKYEPVDSRGSCVYASGLAETTGLWVVEDCSSSYAYFCEYKRMGYTTQVPATTTAGPTYCTNGWSYNQGTQSCYKLMTHGGQTQGMAEQNCVMYGGHLTSIATQEEEQFILTMPDFANFTFTTFWVGLMLTENGYTWLDGSPTNYLHWANAQPDSQHGRENCVTAYKTTLEISDMYCSSYYAYMCKVPPGMGPTTPPPITSSPDVPCPGTNAEDGWLLNGDHCYKVFSETVQTPLAWTEAQRFCREQGSELASIVNDEENSFIMSKVYFLSDYMLWLGGIADYDRIFHWSDGQEFVYINWNKGEPSNYYDQEDCISMYPGIQGYWNDDNCGRVLGFICKRPSGNTVPPPPPTEAPIGNCPTGWIKAGNKCIMVNVEKTTFEVARSRCKSAGVNSDLVSVHGPQMQAALTAILVPMGVTAWIGMKANGPFFWVDQTPVDFTNWGPGEPNNAAGNEFCVEALHNAAQWNDAACDYNRSSVCAQNVDASIQTHTPLPMCPPPFETYINYISRCYKIVTDYKSWEDAEEYCKNDGAHLVTIESLTESSFVYILAADSRVEQAWIGLNSKKDPEQYEWVSGYPVLYTNWGSDQPNVTDETARCVALSSTSSGLWYSSKCDQAKPFLCKYTEGTVPTPDPPANGKCPNNYWLNFGGGYCYLVEPEDTKSWSNANQACIQEGGFLVSIHSQTELDLIAHTTSTTNFNLWSGLIRQTNKEFTWSDGSAYDFMAWGEGEPNSGSEQCVEMYPDTRKWNDVSCDVIRGYVCKAGKVGGTGPDIPTSGPITFPPPNPGVGSSGLSGGAIAGIIIGCLVLIAAVGLVGYSYKNKMAIEKPTRRPHRATSYNNELYNPDDVEASSSSGPVASVRVVDVDGSVEFGTSDTKA